MSIADRIDSAQGMLWRFGDAIDAHWQNVHGDYYPKIESTPSDHTNVIDAYWRAICDQLTCIDKLLVCKSVGGKDLALRKANAALATLYHQYQQVFIDGFIESNDTVVLGDCLAKQSQEELEETCQTNLDQFYDWIVQMEKEVSQSDTRADQRNSNASLKSQRFVSHRKSSGHLIVNH
jgi:hypothetical protein